MLGCLVVKVSGHFSSQKTKLAPSLPPSHPNVLAPFISQVNYIQLRVFFIIIIILLIIITIINVFVIRARHVVSKENMLHTQ